MYINLLHLFKLLHAITQSLLLLGKMYRPWSSLASFSQSICLLWHFLVMYLSNRFTLTSGRHMLFETFVKMIESEEFR